MIRQFLSNTNESATVSILQNFLELNKASMKEQLMAVWHVLRTSIVLL